MVSEMVHPKGFSFKMQRKIVMLKEVRQFEWKDIAKAVKNLSGKKPRHRHCANLYREFNEKLGRRPSRYHNCGRTPYKVNPKVKQFLLKRLKELRRTSPCTSTTLQLELARDMKIQLGADYIRKILRKSGYEWLPRRQKRMYSKEAKKARLHFAKAVLRLSKAELHTKFSMAMDGTVIPMPPADHTDRINFCRHGEEYMWRKRSEAFRPELSGEDPYHLQLPLHRALPLWGGISTGGFAVIAFHPGKKLTKQEWQGIVDRGHLHGAVKKMRPTSTHGPWHVLCDNEGFMTSKESTQACRRVNVKLWHIPAKSPDLNPIERFWGWLKAKLRKMDLADALKGRPVLGKTAFKARVRRVLSSKKAQLVASNHAKSFRATCRLVVQKKGAATGR